MRLTANQRHILLNSLFYAIYTGFGLQFIVPFALALKANNTYIGILSAMPFVAMILSQFPSQALMKRVDRRVLYIALSTPCRFALPIAGFAPIWFGPFALPALLLIIFFGYLLDTMAEPAWLSVMSEMVKQKERGAFFGLRMLTFHIGMTGALVIGGVFLDWFPDGETDGFLVIFILAAFFGLLSTFNFQKIHPKPYRDHKDHSLKEFFTFKGMFGKFIFFVFCFSFGHMFAAPFFKVYILEDLALSYTFYVVAMAMSTVGRLISIVHIGKVADVVGDKKVAVIAAFAIVFSPLAYLFIHKPTFWLIIPVQLIIGIAWAGIEISTLNLLLDFSSEKNRGLRAAQYYTVAAVPMVIAPIIGGYVADNISLAGFSGIPLVFLIAVGLRSLPAFLLFRLRNVRAKKRATYLQVFKEVVSINPALEAKRSIKELEHVVRHGHHVHKVNR